jgi:hypothetical protein
MLLWMLLLLVLLLFSTVMSRRTNFVAAHGEPPVGTYEGKGTGHLSGGGMSGGTGGTGSGDGCQSPPKGQHHH